MLICTVRNTTHINWSDQWYSDTDALAGVGGSIDSIGGVVMVVLLLIQVVYYS